MHFLFPLSEFGLARACGGLVLVVTDSQLREVIRVSILLCLEDAVSLESSLPSGAHNYSATSSA